MICEACGNAVRHGECNSIVLECSILPEKVVLIIKDDGIGINPHEINQKKGLGLQNMLDIVRTYMGTFSINRIADVGTLLKIEIPNVLNQRKQEVAGL